MNVVVDPAFGLLNAQTSPFLLGKNFTFEGEIFHDLQRQDNVPVLIVAVTIFIGVFNFGRVLRHYSLLSKF